jgi:GntR family transcriptional regulator
VAAQFKISRPTANKILASLVSEGLLEFRKGVGTFVTRGGLLDYNLQHLVSFTQKTRAAGKKPFTRVLCLEQYLNSEIPREVMVKLQVQTRQHVYYFERLRSADGVPVIYERRYVPERLCPNLKKYKLCHSLYELWTLYYKHTIIGAKQSINAVNLTPKEAKLLKLPPGTAALKVTAVGYMEADNGRALWYEETIYRSDQYSFETTLGGITPERPTIGRLVLKSKWPKVPPLAQDTQNSSQTSG